MDSETATYGLNSDETELRRYNNDEMLPKSASSFPSLPEMTSEDPVFSDNTIGVALPTESVSTSYQEDDEVESCIEMYYRRD